MFVPTKDLPDVVRAVLKDVGFHGKDIDVEPATTVALRTPYGTGYQTFAVGVDIAGGRVSREVVSSWGGDNMFEHRTLDKPNKLELPPDTMLIMGQRGGGRPVNAKLYAHPDLMAPLLEAGPAAGAELPMEYLAVLGLFSALKAFARRDEAHRYKLPFDEAVAALVEAGLLKQSRTGATQITGEGRNVLHQTGKAIRAAGYSFMQVF